MHTIKPYRLDDGKTWAFDDDAVGLLAEPFVFGMSEMLDAFLDEQRINPDDRGFELKFSDTPIGIGYWKKLEWESEYEDGNWYKATINRRIMRGWLCPALFKYFEVAPRIIYVSVVGA